MAGCLFVGVGDPEQRALTQGVSSSWSPPGSPAGVNPMGTVTAGKPVGGDNWGELLPSGVVRSPSSLGRVGSSSGTPGR